MTRRIAIPGHFHAFAATMALLARGCDTTGDLEISIQQWCQQDASLTGARN